VIAPITALRPQRHLEDRVISLPPSFDFMSWRSAVDSRGLGPSTPFRPNDYAASPFLS
jgi:hypothetical protein